MKLERIREPSDRISPSQITNLANLICWRSCEKARRRSAPDISLLRVQLQRLRVEASATKTPEAWPAARMMPCERSGSRWIGIAGRPRFPTTNAEMTTRMNGDLRVALGATRWTCLCRTTKPTVVRGTLTKSSGDGAERQVQPGHQRACAADRQALGGERRSGAFADGVKCKTRRRSAVLQRWGCAIKRCAAGRTPRRPEPDMPHWYGGPPAARGGYAEDERFMARRAQKLRGRRLSSLNSSAFRRGRRTSCVWMRRTITA